MEKKKYRHQASLFPKIQRSSLVRQKTNESILNCDSGSITRQRKKSFSFSKIGFAREALLVVEGPLLVGAAGRGVDPHAAAPGGSASAPAATSYREKARLE